MAINHQLFLSAVSVEFRLCREMLRTALTGPDMPWKVAEQSDFAVGGSTLLEKLDRYIGESRAVIHLVGEALGALAVPLEVEAFLQARPTFLARFPRFRNAIGDGHALSYTQWEALMALDHGVALFVYFPDEQFMDRQPGFVTIAADVIAQQAHLQRLMDLGQDRSAFASAERLCTMVLRSMAGLFASSGEKADQDFAQSLAGAAAVRESNEPAPANERATILPFQLELRLPAHLIVGQSCRVEFHLREPNNTALEDLKVELEIGSVKIATHHDLLPRGASIRLMGDTQLIPLEAGNPPLKIAVTCTRLSSLEERFEWIDFATVHPAEAARAISGTARAQLLTQPVPLLFKSEKLRPHQGSLGLELRPILAAGQRFEMGSAKTERGHQPDEELHPVRFSRSWWMARHPVSQQQFLTLMGTNPARFCDQSLDFPVESITWAEAMEFCERLTQCAPT